MRHILRGTCRVTPLRREVEKCSSVRTFPNGSDIKPESDASARELREQPEANLLFPPKTCAFEMARLFISSHFAFFSFFFFSVNLFHPLSLMPFLQRLHLTIRLMSPSNFRLILTEAFKLTTNWTWNRSKFFCFLSNSPSSVRPQKCFRTFSVIYNFVFRELNAGE